MNINTLIDTFNYANKNYNSETQYFLNAINIISNYTMYEQTIIKKDSVSSVKSKIEYTYDKLSYSAIKKLIDNINFIEEPTIGASKEVILLNSSEDEIKNKIYILDKIKDSFMHLNNDLTMYEFDDEYSKIYINNVSHDFSLKCVIPIKDLKEFNDTIKNNFFIEDDEIKWVSDIKNSNKYSNITKYKNIEILKSKEGRVIKINGSPQNIYYKYYQDNDNILESEYLSYHTYSYLSLLKSTCFEYPILNSLYNLNIYTNHIEFISKSNSIINNMVNFYTKYSSVYEYLTSEKRANYLSRYMSMLINDLSQINLYLLSYMRNARAHANKLGDNNYNIYYYNVKDNTKKLNQTQESTPTFIIKDTNININKLFEEINDYSITKDDYTKLITDLINNGVYNEFIDDYLRQVYNYIILCKRNINNPNIDVLLKERGNASDFVDFIKKTIDNTFDNNVTRIR